MLGFGSQRLANPKQGNEKMKVVNWEIEATGHVANSTENLGALQPPRVRCSCEFIYSERSSLLLQCHNCP
jgi:hypothetical protein